MQMGVSVDGCETMDEKELGRTYVVSPSYPLAAAKADAALLLNHLYCEDVDDDTDNETLLEVSMNGMVEKVVASDSVNDDNPADKPGTFEYPQKAAENDNDYLSGDSSDLREPRGDTPLPPHEICSNASGDGRVKAGLVGKVEPNAVFPPLYHEHIASIKALYQEPTSAGNLSSKTILKSCKLSFYCSESLPNSRTATSQVLYP
jgi:hypothetical protein